MGSTPLLGELWKRFTSYIKYAYFLLTSNPYTQLYTSKRRSLSITVCQWVVVGSLVAQLYAQPFCSKKLNTYVDPWRFADLFSIVTTSDLPFTPMQPWSVSVDLFVFNSIAAATSNWRQPGVRSSRGRWFEHSPTAVFIFRFFFNSPPPCCNLLLSLKKKYRHSPWNHSRRSGCWLCLSYRSWCSLWFKSRSWRGLGEIIVCFSKGCIGMSYLQKCFWTKFGLWISK